jgi:hypothetical protein
MPEEIGTLAAPAVTETTPVSTPETPAPETTSVPDGAPAEGVGEIEQPATPAEGEETEPVEPEPEDDSDYERDGEKIEATKREALKALKKVNPAAAKTLTDDHFRLNSIVKEMGSKNASEAVNQVRQMKATIDSLGGHEGIEELTTKVADYDKEIGQFANGDPALLQELIEANPESFVTMAQNGLELIAKLGQDQLDKALLPTMVARLEGAGMYASIEQLLGFIKDGKGQEAYDLTNQIRDWMGKAKNFAGKQVELKTQRDPREEELNQREQEFQRKEKEAYDKRAIGDVNKLNNGVMSKAAAQFFKEVGLKPPGQAAFNEALTKRIWAKMAADQPYLRAARAIQAKGELERHVNFVHGKFNELLPDEFRKLRNEMYPNYKPVNGAAKPAAKPAPPKAPGTPQTPAEKAKAATAAPDNVGMVMIGAKPDRDDVDWAKDPSRMLWISGRAYMVKGPYKGKLVKWPVHS